MFPLYGRVISGENSVDPDNLMPDNLLLYLFFQIETFMCALLRSNTLLSINSTQENLFKVFANITGADQTDQRFSVVRIWNEEQNNVANDVL